MLLANGDAIANGNNEGCGALEGWCTKHREEWRGGYRTFSGHLKARTGFREVLVVPAVGTRGA